MAKAVLKTAKTKNSVPQFLGAVADEQKKADAFAVDALMAELTGEAGKMWGDSIVGYGTCYLKYESGRELDWMLTGFSPRKQNLSLYIMSGFERYDGLLAKLGKFKIGKSCLYIKKLSDIDLDVLRELIENSIAHMRKVDERNRNGA